MRAPTTGGGSFSAAGRQVRLINPRFVKPFVKGSKNDAADAEGFSRRPHARRCGSCRSKNMPAGLQSLHRVRERLVAAAHEPDQSPTRAARRIWLVYPKGRALCPESPAGSPKPASRDGADDFRSDSSTNSRCQRAARLTRRPDTRRSARATPTCRRLMKLPGVGPIVRPRSSPASAIAPVPLQGGELAAWIGLVPRQYTTGGKSRLGGMGRRANHYLRRQIVQARERHCDEEHDDTRSRWLKAVIVVGNSIRAIVALANKTAGSPGPCCAGVRNMRATPMRAGRAQATSECEMKMMAVGMDRDLGA